MNKQDEYLESLISKKTSELNRDEIIYISNNYRNERHRAKLKEYFSNMDIAINRCSTQKHTIVFSSPSETGTSYFRIFEPLLSMYRYTDDYNLVYTESIQPWHYNIADLLVLHRAGEAHSLTHNIMAHWPKDKPRPYIIHNVDDNEFNLPKSHPMREIWIAQEKDKMSIFSLTKSDAVEITTNKMKAIMTPINRNVHITKNNFNFKLPQWNLEKHKDFDYEYWGVEKDPLYTKFSFFENYDESKDIVIGWAGLTSHFEDLKKMKPILKIIHDKYPNTKFILAGMALKDSQFIIKVNERGEKIMEELPIADKSSLYSTKVQNLYGDFDPSRLKIYDALNLETYGWFYSLFDIGIAYIEHNAFNSCKRSIKFLEFGFYNTIALTSKYGGYYDTATEMEADKIDTSKFICINESVSMWTDKLSYLVENYRTSEMNTLQNKIHDFVVKHYDHDKNIEEKIAWYKRLIEGNTERENERIIKDSYALMYSTTYADAAEMAV